jgi:chromosome segregation ATPase
MQVNPSGLLGLVMQIDNELRNEGKSFDEILAKYPVSKTSLPYMLTLVEEFSIMMLDLTKDYGELEEENNKLKERLRYFESKKGDFDTQYITKLQSELERLKNENQILKSENGRLASDLNELDEQLRECELLFSFLSSSWIGSYLLKRFEYAKSKK